MATRSRWRPVILSGSGIGRLMARPPRRFGLLRQLASGHLSDQHGNPPPSGNW